MTIWNWNLLPRALALGSFLTLFVPKTYGAQKDSYIQYCPTTGLQISESNQYCELTDYLELQTTRPGEQVRFHGIFHWFENGCSQGLLFAFKGCKVLSPRKLTHVQLIRNGIWSPEETLVAVLSPKHRVSVRHARDNLHNLGVEPDSEVYVLNGELRESGSGSQNCLLPKMDSSIRKYSFVAGAEVLDMPADECSKWDHVTGASITDLGSRLKVDSTGNFVPSCELKQTAGGKCDQFWRIGSEDSAWSDLAINLSSRAQTSKAGVINIEKVLTSGIRFNEPKRARRAFELGDNYVRCYANWGSIVCEYGMENLCTNYAWAQDGRPGGYARTTHLGTKMLTRKQCLYNEDETTKRSQRNFLVKLFPNEPEIYNACYSILGDIIFRNGRTETEIRTYCFYRAFGYNVCIWRNPQLRVVMGITPAYYQKSCIFDSVPTKPTTTTTTSTTTQPTTTTSTSTTPRPTTTTSTSTTPQPTTSTSTSTTPNPTGSPIKPKPPTEVKPEPVGTAHFTGEPYPVPPTGILDPEGDPGDFPSFYDYIEAPLDSNGLTAGSGKPHKETITITINQNGQLTGTGDGTTSGAALEISKVEDPEVNYDDINYDDEKRSRASRMRSDSNFAASCEDEVGLPTCVRRRGDQLPVQII